MSTPVSGSEGLDIQEINPLVAGYVAAHVIDSEDGEYYILVCLREPRGGDRVRIAIPDHEHTGPLPNHVQVSVDWHLRDHCAGTRRDGKPCRAVVSHPGERCRWHR